MRDFTELIDLAAERLGGAVIAANDEFFASRENLLKASDAGCRPGLYTDRGHWMDGWETRRRREPGYDWCLVRLGLAGRVCGVIVDTSHFTGNYPESCSLEACSADGHPTAAELTASRAVWNEILPRSPLGGDSRNVFPLVETERVTYVRLNIFPDGGVARLRVFGTVLPDWTRLTRRGREIDLASVAHGGRVIAASDMFFGSRHNLIMPGEPRTMGEGWETRRRRGPGCDWAVVRLGRAGTLRRIEIDTTHYKGNAPESCALEVTDRGEGLAADLSGAGTIWTEVLPRTRLQPHARHRFELPAPAGPATHARLSIFPDGGIARLRLFGRVSADPPD